MNKFDFDHVYLWVERTIESWDQTKLRDFLDLLMHCYKKTSSLERNELLRTVKRLGRTIWKNWSGYHRRSLIENKMHYIKLLGDKLRARNFQSQVNEIHARVAVLNKFTDLGRPLTQVAT